MDKDGGAYFAGQMAGTAWQMAIGVGAGSKCLSGANYLQKSATAYNQLSTAKGWADFTQRRLNGEKVGVGDALMMAQAAGPAYRQLGKWIGGCFVAGTPVHLSALPYHCWADEAFAQWDGDAESATDYGGLESESRGTPTAVLAQRLTKPVDQVPLGARVATQNPRREDYDWSFDEPQQKTWRKITVQVVRHDGAVVDIDWLRPADWLAAKGLVVGASVNIQLPELRLDGVATVEAIEACPEIASGEGHVVTGRLVTRRCNDLVKVLLSNGESLTGTSPHPVWSRTRQDWVALGDLAPGEELWTIPETVRVESVSRLHTDAPVYNIEVHGEHVYRVGDSGVLVHNTGTEELCKLAARAGAYRALRPEDAKAIATGQRILPKSSTGSILDHIQGRDSKYLSISMTKGGTAKYAGPHGVAEIDLDVALATGSGLVPYKQVLQVARKQGTTNDVKNVIAAQEALLTHGLDPRAIIRVTKAKN